MANDQEKIPSAQDQSQQDELPSVVEKPPIPAELKNLDAKTFAAAREFFSFHSGPLPPADQLAKYETACPGAARDIVNMAKAEQTSRHRVMQVQVDSIPRGQRFALTCFLAAMATACFIAYEGGATQAASTVVGVAIVFGGAFILGKHFERESDDSETQHGPGKG